MVALLLAALPALLADVQLQACPRAPASPWLGTGLAVAVEGSREDTRRGSYRCQRVQGDGFAVEACTGPERSFPAAPRELRQRHARSVTRALRPVTRLDSPERETLGRAFSGSLARVEQRRGRVLWWAAIFGSSLECRAEGEPGEQACARALGTLCLAP